MVENVLRQVIEGFVKLLAVVVVVSLVLGALVGGAALLMLICWHAAFGVEGIVVNIAGYVGLAFCACCGVYAALWLKRQDILAVAKDFGTDVYDWIRGRS